MGSGASHYDWSMTGGEPWSQGERFERFREAVEIVDRLLREDVTTYNGLHYRVREAAIQPRPLQRPRPPLTIAARGPRMVKLAARYADTWNTEAYYEEVWRDGATAADAFRITHERGELLDETAVALGRDPGSIVRSLLAGYAPGLEAPWASADAVREIVGRYREVGFTEFIFPEPGADETAAFERAVREVIPELRGAAVTSFGVKQ
jgi:alkanesulfonate monooxygenase SsuD/methylene tetrahydromethanopterin reductase-like flavin-dependent oxidoreductase (luciferase family)